MIIVLSFSIFGFYISSQSQIVLQKALGEEATTFAQHQIGEIDSQIHGRIEEIEATSRDLLLQEYIINSNQEFEQLINIQEYINEKDQEWISAADEEVTPFMQEIIDNKMSQELIVANDYFKEKYDYPIFGEIFVTNKYGTNVAQTGKTTDYYQADEEWWQIAKNDGFYISNIDFDESSKINSNEICLRIVDEDGNFLGVIKAVLNIKTIITSIQMMEPGMIHEEHTTMEYILLTNDGRIIYSTEEHEILSVAPDDLKSLAHPSDIEDTPYFIKEDDASGEKDELVAHAHSKGYHDFEGLGWTLVVEHTVDEVFASSFELRNMFFFLIIIVSIIVLLYSVFVSRTISKPITKLADIVSKISIDGNLDEKVGLTSKDEIGTLSRAFDKMTTNLKKTTTSIEILNQEITLRKQKETELKHSSLRLRESEEKFQAISSNAKDCIVMIDSRGDITFWNKAAEKMFGYTLEKAIGKNFHMVFTPKRFHEDYLRGFNKFIKTGKGHSVGKTIELAALKKDGTEFPAEFSVSALKLKNEWFGVGMIRDISDRKLAEAKLQKMFTDLGTMNEKMEIVGRLTRHDVRNKLSAVLGNIYLAKQALPPENESMKYLNETELAVNQIEKIFDFARIYEKLGKEKLSPIDVGKSFGTAVSLINSQNGVDFENECRGLLVHADSLLSQLFLTMIDNSLRHGEKVSKIKIHHKTSDDALRIFIEDDGIGIPNEKKEIIFKEGYGKNTGLGLHLVKLMCKVYGWTIKETGKQGKGAQFTITIPETNLEGKAGYQLH